MSSNSSPAVPLLLSALAAAGVAFGIHWLGREARIAPAVEVVGVAKPRWTATAQGRVEPRTGEVRLGALAAGRIDDVLVAANDTVKAGDLLLRVDDAEILARLVGVESEAQVRKRERDTETNVPKLAQDRRAAEDKLYASERAVAAARLALDRLVIQRHHTPASVTADQLAAARKALDEATARLAPEREALRQAQAASGVPLPTRLEAGVTAARAEVAALDVVLERTRVRAPFDGTILGLNASAGETAAPSPEATLITIGDLAKLRVRAEVEERDAAKVELGQRVVLKTDAFPDREFAGKVTTIASAMRPPRLAQRGPRRPNDLDTLEVMVEVDPGSALKPGMRVDVFFRADGEASSAPRTSAPRDGTAAPAVKASEAPGGAAQPRAN